MEKYFGITYPECSDEKLKEWKKKHCCKNEHLFDEVLNVDEHFLVCDACQLMIYIKKIDTKYVKARKS